MPVLVEEESYQENRDVYIVQGDVEAFPWDAFGGDQVVLSVLLGAHHGGGREHVQALVSMLQRI